MWSESCFNRLFRGLILKIFDKLANLCVSTCSTYLVKDVPGDGFQVKGHTEGDMVLFVKDLFTKLEGTGWGVGDYQPDFKDETEFALTIKKTMREPNK
jgi:hypothetical protein